VSGGVRGVGGHGLGAGRCDVSAPTSPLKWVGGKAWLVEAHRCYLPKPALGATYREPFVGGASVFLGAYHAHRPAVLSDANARLLAVYEAVRDEPEALIRELGRHPYARDHYLAVRARLNSEPGAPLVERAAWFIVINKHGFNGLYRENARGECNTPFGDAGSAHLALTGTLRACSAALQGVTIRHCGYLDALAPTRPGDAIFLDPPYVPVSSTANFTGYTSSGFGPADQRALVAELDRLDAIGARWCLTNSDTPEARALYEGRGWHLASVAARETLGCKVSTRGMRRELIVTNYAVSVAAARQVEMWPAVARGGGVE